MRKWINRLGYLLRHRHRDEELHAEIRIHGEMRQEALEQAGLLPDEAARASRRAMGNVTLAREDSRAAWLAPWLQSLGQDTIFALRTMRRAPGFAAAMIVVTALGISASTAVFGLIDRLVLADLPVRQPGRLVWFKDPSFSYAIVTAMRARSSPLFSGLFAWNVERRSVQWQDALEPVDVLMGSGEFYATLGVGAAIGRAFGPDDERAGGGPGGAVALISDGCWQRRFGRDPGVIGRVVRIDDVAFTVIGVTPPGFFGVAPGLAPEITVPLTAGAAPGLQVSPSAGLHLMGRLRDGLTLTAANAILQGVWPDVLETATAASMPRDRRAMYLARTTALEPGHAGYSRVRNQFQAPLWVLLGLGGLLSAAATASTASLLLARGLTRRREIAVRLAIGASRARVVRQCLVEATVWTAAGAALGIGLASWSAGALVAALSTWKSPIALEVGPDARMVSFASILAIATAWLSAGPPALWLTGRALNQEMKTSRGAGAALGRRWSPGSWLVAGQVAVAIVLLAGASLFITSLRRIVSQDAGFDRSDILVVSADAASAGYRDGRQLPFYEALRDRLARLPGVRSASVSWYPPVSDQEGHWTRSVGIDGAPVGTDDSRPVYFNAVSPGYFATVGIPLVAGRDFASRDDDRSARVVIVNQSLARRHFPTGGVLGRRISVGLDPSRRDLEIVGIVGDATYQRLQEAPRSIAYLPHTQHTGLLASASLAIEVRTAGPLRLSTGLVVQEIGAIDRRVPVHVETIADRIDDTLVKERIVARLSMVLGMAALTLACASVYGLLTCVVSQQRREMGVRRALGAPRAALLWMIVRQSLLLSAAGSAAGLAVSLGLGRFVRTLLFQVEPSNPVALGSAAVVVLAATVCAAYLPARRASTIDPLVAIKEE